MSDNSLNSPERQTEISEQFEEADALSRLEGYEPEPFEEEQKRKIVTGEFTTEQFIAAMTAHVLAE